MGDQESCASLRRAQASGIRRELEVAATRMIAQQVPLPWVGQYICQEAVEQVLVGAVGVLHELGLQDATLLRVPPAELAPLWVERIRGALDVSWRAPPQVVQLQYDTIAAVAGCAHAMIKQSARYRHFLQYGPPPGVAELPALASSEKAKTLPMPFTLRGNPATEQDKRFQAYMSHMRALQRRPGARSTGCQRPPDTERPELYT